LFVYSRVAAVEGDVRASRIGETFEDDIDIMRYCQEKSKLEQDVRYSYNRLHFYAGVIPKEGETNGLCEGGKRKLAHLMRQHMSSKISEGEFESSIGAIDDDLDGDKGVRANWYSVRRLCSHGRQISL
jgi:hypothetical protein